MKINKRKCRKFANPDRKLHSDSGILHAEQIDYVVTTAIKNIANHRTLILYIYPREQASEGDCPIGANLRKNCLKKYDLKEN